MFNTVDSGKMLKLRAASADISEWRQFLLKERQHKDKPMQNRKTVVASLEGARVVVDQKYYALEWYNFEDDSWVPREKSEFPLPRETAESWLQGWNAVDRLAVLNLLTA